MPEQTPHRSFTIRTPLNLYCEIAEMARADGVSINHKVQQLLRLGMDRHISLDEAVRRLIMEKITEEDTSGQES